MVFVERNAPIGIFDSGVGGISVLAECIRQLPGEDFIYFGDTLNAPYGTKTTGEILRLCENVADILTEKGVKAIVIACNTATAAAAEALRENTARYPFPVIGMEPALKLAKNEVGEDKKVLVLATPSTIASEKYARLLSRFGENTVSLPCPGLMEFVERLEFDSPALHT
ncbi:MAG: glutamate racemase [Clostridiales bacterium]|nr:glutamate racemase [Clostridiales bacterium]